MKKFFPNCDSSQRGQIYLKGVTGTELVTSGAVGKMENGRSAVPQQNIISKETLFQTKVKTHLTQTQDTDTEIKLFVKPKM